MTDKINHIKNPLTVIAIFAGIAEVSGTAVLPFIGSENQSIYTYFLMWFPTYLVTVFFLILVFKNRVLYAPSDFRDDRSFLDCLRLESFETKVKEIDREIREFSEVPPDLQREGPELNLKLSQSPFSLREQYLKAESLAIEVMAKKLGLPLSRNVTAKNADLEATFDAAAIKSGRLIAIEVKYIWNTRSILNSVRDSLKRYVRFFSDESESRRSTIDFSFVVVLSREIGGQKEPVIRILEELRSEFPFVDEFRVFGIDELEGNSKSES